MRREIASLVGLLAILIVAAEGSAGRRELEAACGNASWSVVGGAVTIGPLQIGTLSLGDEGPIVAQRCRLKRWSVGGAIQHRLRALYSCTTVDEDGLEHDLTLRLRLRIAKGCDAMEGALVIKRPRAGVDFSATRTGSPCSAD